MQRSEHRERTATQADGSSRDRDSDSDRGRLSRLFSVKTFFVSLLVAAAGVLAGGAVPLVGGLGQFVGLFLATFVLGVVGSRRHYTEVVLAGGVVAAVSVVVGTLGSVFLPFGVRLLADYGVGIAALGVGAGAIAALLGYYFGRDLRDGLTREV